MFLTQDQIIDLTGRQKPVLQRRWLIEHGYKFEVRADGRPVVLASVIETKLGGRVVPRIRPDFSVLG